MWTYLAIFLSITALVAVFVRRAYLCFRKKKQDAPEEGNVREEETVKEKKKRLSKDDSESLKDLFNRAEAMINAGNEEEAIKCFVQILAIDASHKETKNKLAMLYMHKNMFSAAAALFRQLAEQEEDSVHFSHLGLALFSQKDFEEAKKAYQRAVEIDPSRPQRFVSLCQVYRSTGEPSKAVIALNKAIDLENENPDYLFLLADLLFELEQIEESKSQLRKVLKLDPEHDEAKKMLKEIRAMEKEA